MHSPEHPHPGSWDRGRTSTKTRARLWSKDFRLGLCRQVWLHVWASSVGWRTSSHTRFNKNLMWGPAWPRFPSF